MKFRDTLKLASRDLGKRKGRTFLTSLAVAVGTMLIVTLVSLGTSGENLILSKVQDSSQLKTADISPMKYFNSDNTDYSTLDMNDMFKKIDDSTVKKLSAISGVHETEAMLNATANNISIDTKNNKNDTQLIGLYNNNTMFPSETIDSVRQDNKNNSLKPIIAGRNLNKDDTNAVLVGKNYLASLGIKDYKSMIGKDITLTESKTENPTITLPELKITGKIVGVIGDKFEGDNHVITSIDMVNKFKSYYSLQDNYINSQGYDSVVLYANNINDMDHIGSSIKKLNYFYITYADQIASVKKAFNVMNIILAVLGLVVLFVAGIGTANTMVMVIYERTKSIGIMKAIGASRSNIHSIFILQSGIIGFLGGIMGLIFSLINMNIIHLALNAYLKSKKITETVNFSMPSYLIVGTLAFSIVITIISGLYPAVKASKMDPINALNS
ncbi:MAG: FtsX-like permease family protein [Clostridium sp.]|nr:FtsX-like permease family protein [Clostridium sp.]